MSRRVTTSFRPSGGESGPGREATFAWAFVTINGVDVPDLLLRATPGSTISGSVIFEGDGPSVQALTITTSRADLDRTPNSTAAGEVGSDLRFTMTGIRGPRRITLGRAPNGWMLKSVSANGVDVTDVPLPFGTADESLSDVQVVVTSRITELSGTVADSHGDLTKRLHAARFSSGSRSLVSRIAVLPPLRSCGCRELHRARSAAVGLLRRAGGRMECAERRR